LTKLSHTLTDGGDGLGCALIVEAIAACDRGNTHGLAQLVKDPRAPA
jgi:hypothetical protein